MKISVHERRHSKILQQPLAAQRGGIMLHYDDSSRDDWAVEWFEDSRCTNGYTWLVLDDGRVVELADPAYRTPHAGACRTPRANSVFYGIAAATNGLTLATELQLESIVRICAAVARSEGWSADSIGERIVGHDREAIWTPESTPIRERWGKLGRKSDPTGTRPDLLPVIDVGRVRGHVARLLMTGGT
jgi:N-acetyl-anhydromuramyl-L-alanine amidase AmpD